MLVHVIIAFCIVSCVVAQCGCPCFNGGTCTRDPRSGNSVCKCVSEWTGADCTLRYPFRAVHFRGEGCYDDTLQNVLPTRLADVETTNPYECYYRCILNNYAYGGVENVKMCFCGNAFNKTQPRPITECRRSTPPLFGTAKDRIAVFYVSFSSTLPPG